MFRVQGIGRNPQNVEADARDLRGMHGLPAFSRGKFAKLPHAGVGQNSGYRFWSPKNKNHSILGFPYLSYGLNPSIPLNNRP